MLAAALGPTLVSCAGSAGDGATADGERAAGVTGDTDSADDGETSTEALAGVRFDVRRDPG
jgi:hypothetical protein